jgi:hypothetical protein
LLEAGYFQFFSNFLWPNWFFEFQNPELREVFWSCLPVYEVGLSINSLSLSDLDFEISDVNDVIIKKMSRQGRVCQLGRVRGLIPTSHESHAPRATRISQYLSSLFFLFKNRIISQDKTFRKLKK